MADLYLNSAIPSEGSMQTSWPALHNNCCAVQEDSLALHLGAGILPADTGAQGN